VAVHSISILSFSSPKKNLGLFLVITLLPFHSSRWAHLILEMDPQLSKPIRIIYPLGERLGYSMGI
jgi:hypothetical protein